MDRWLWRAPGSSPWQKGPKNIVLEEAPKNKFRFTLRSRGSLIAATVVLQAAVIGGGWAALSSLARRDLAGRVSDQAQVRAAQVVRQFDELLEKSVDGRIIDRSPAWEAAQALVESYRSAAGTSVFLLDTDGRVLCHPSLRQSPNLRRVDYGEQLITLSKQGTPMKLASLKPESTVSGTTNFVSGPAQISLMEDPVRGVKIVAITPEASIAAAAETVASGTRLWMVLGGSVILACTLAGSILLVRRYDTMLERMNKQLETEVQRRTRRGLSIRNGLIFGLAKLADYRDTDTGQHLDRICRYCEILAEQLQSEFGEIDRVWIERLKLASSLHDIGKVGIPDSILLKPGALTPDERRVMEQHPVIGGETLGAVRRLLGEDELIGMGIQVALQHHERWDGKGYPFGLAGERISLSARIVALADVYDALTSRRVYKAAMGHEQAREIIAKGRGTQFDARVVDGFERVHETFNEVRRDLQGADVDDDRPRLVMAADQLRDALRKDAA
jgi:HD-GYP domain-containing protein (c-di-GMP phosphodiesterase class II)